MILKCCLLFAVVVCVATLSAQQPGRDNAASANPHIRLFANVLRDSVWTSPRIFVCWENLAEPYQTSAGFVQSAISSTWERESRVFVSWAGKPALLRTPGFESESTILVLTPKA